MVAGTFLGVALVLSPTNSVAHQSKEGGRLAKIGPAPTFTLTTVDGGRLPLDDLRGRVVAVTFIYATCADTCPLLTAKLTGLQSASVRISAGGSTSSPLPSTRSETRRTRSVTTPGRMGRTRSAGPF